MDTHSALIGEAQIPQGGMSSEQDHVNNLVVSLAQNMEQEEGLVRKATEANEAVPSYPWGV